MVLTLKSLRYFTTVQYWHDAAWHRPFYSEFVLLETSQSHFYLFICLFQTKRSDNVQHARDCHVTDSWNYSVSIMSKKPYHHHTANNLWVMYCIHGRVARYLWGILKSNVTQMLLFFVLYSFTASKIHFIGIFSVMRKQWKSRAQK